MSNWISVIEQLPPVGNDKYYTGHSAAVLVSDGERVYGGTWVYSHDERGWLMSSLSEGWRPEEYFDYGGKEITHWQPLPEPPEKEQQPLYARPPSITPPGWKLVPMEPTEKWYYETGLDTDLDGGEFCEICRAIIAAAPEYKEG